MKIEFESTKDTTGYLSVTSGDAEINYDAVVYTNGKWYISGEDIMQLINAAAGMSRFNRVDDSVFVKQIADHLLNDKEKSELVELLLSNEE